MQKRFSTGTVALLRYRKKEAGLRLARLRPSFLVHSNIEVGALVGALFIIGETCDISFLNIASSPFHFEALFLL
jgi:hypothetical protein